MFRRKVDTPSEADNIHAIIEALADMEPKQMDRIVALAKEKRTCSQKIDAFIGTATIKPAKLEFEEM